MKMKMALLAGSILVLPALAQAQPVEGLYVGAGFGANFGQNQTIKRLDFGAAGNVTAHAHPKFDVGPVGVVSLGYGLGNGLRVEVEGDYRNNRMRSVGNLPNSGGREEQYGAMANVLYDVDVAPYGVTLALPYVGVGAGYMRNDFDKVHGGVPGAEVGINKTVGGLAVQGIVGAAVPMGSMVPGLDLTVEYRAMAMPEDRKYTVSLDTGATSFRGKAKVSDDINHSVMVGFRYAFNQPVPPMAPAPTTPPTASPAPPAARTYLVFFDWDHADLTSRAREIISQAAQNSTKTQYTRIEVDGHADRTGTAAYNQRLSMRRAQNVAAELVKDGVPQGSIDVQAFGDTHPLVPTAAGVREPQNRRVEIILK